MAMYYQGGSENQADGLQTFYLMNPNYVGNYSDHPTNMLLFNSPVDTSSSAIHTHQQVVSIPPNRPSPASGHQQQIPGPHDILPRLGYDSWPNMAQQTPQGLSLSLSTNQTGFKKPVVNSCQDFPSSEVQSNIGVNSNMQSVILGSKYLKAAQQLLDEVANVGKRFMPNYDKGDDQGSKDKAKIIKEAKYNYGDSTEAASGGGELTTAQRQEIQMKKAKLISMLDEVEQRYRQYNIQMHIIVASFEQAAGIGSAKSYTQLALSTISKQFRCLKDAISAQVNALSKSLGEEGKTEGAKLKYVDNQLGQHRALQQLGMVPWRPQRGLPERAVSVLRAWLFEHFLHPYPKDTDKQMLAKQTGLTRGQVSNWFINARVRLWKPMVEEMYSEEMKNQQQTNTSSDNNPTKTSHVHQSNFISTSPKNVSIPPGPSSAQLISPPNIESSSKKPRNSPNQDDSPNSILSVETETKAATYAITRGNMYETFNPGQLRTAFHGNYSNAQNTVSLTLGLPPSRSSPGTQNFFNFGMANEAELVEHEKVNNMGYEQILGLQNRKPFPAQLLPDFVA